MQTFSFHL